MQHLNAAPSIGLALGSGASRGWSHIGVIKALLAEGIEPDFVSGTSIGAIIGGAYVAGNLDRLEQWVLGANRSDVLKFFGVKFAQTGFVDAERLNLFLHEYVAGDDVCIEDLQKKFTAVSTEIETGREAWLTEGRVADAVRASMAMPGLFSPVRRNQRWLVDGGLVNPVPVSTCRAQGADIVIAVSLNSDIVGKRDNRNKKTHLEESNGLFSNIRQQAKIYSNSIFPNREEKDEAPGLIYAITTSINIMQERITRSRLAGDPADILLSPRLGHIGMLEFHRAAEAIEEGGICVMKALDDISRILGKD